MHREPLEKNQFIGAMTNVADVHSVTLAYSLLNLSLTYDPSGTFAYTSYWTDTAEEVLAYAMQVQLAVMNYGLFQGNNTFWAVVENLKSKRDLAWVSGGMLRLLSNRYKAANTWLPMSQKELDIHAPLILVLLKLLQRNPALREVTPWPPTSSGTTASWTTATPCTWRPSAGTWTSCRSCCSSK